MCALLRSYLSVFYFNVFRQGDTAAGRRWKRREYDDDDSKPTTFVSSASLQMLNSASASSENKAPASSAATADSCKQSACEYAVCRTCTDHHFSVHLNVHLQRSVPWWRPLVMLPGGAPCW